MPSLDETTRFQAIYDRLLSAANLPLSRRTAITSAAVIGIMPRISSSQRVAGQASPPAATDVELHLPFNPYGQAVTVHPHLAPNWGPFWVMLPYAWSGLLRFNELGAVEMDLAESFEPNDDGSMWTALIRDGAVFANGDPISAQHVIDSWKRALDPVRVAPMASYFAPIAGFDDFISGESTDLGLVAIDDRTVEITLTEPLAWFPSWAATFGYAIVHPALSAVTLATPPAEGDVSIDQASAGLWCISDVDEQSHIRMVPNPQTTSSPSVTSIVWDIAPGGGTDQAILDWYAANQTAVADVPTSLVESILADETLAADINSISPSGSVLTISMDFRQKPFDDVRVRRAVAQSIDQATWSVEIQAETYIPATSFVPPVIAEIAGYTPAESIGFDAEGAKTSLADAGFDPETGTEEITFYQPVTDSIEQIERTAALLKMIGDHSGLTITHNTTLTREQITALRQDNGGLQFNIQQWQVDSDVPSLLEIATEDSEFNHGWFNWSSDLENTGDFTPGVDAQAFSENIAAARTTMDQDERNALFAASEELLLKNAVVVPVGFWTPMFLRKQWLLGTRHGPWTGSTPLNIDESVTVAEGWDAE